MPWSVDDLLQQWHFKCKFACGRILWKFLLYAFLWKVWLERNNRIFKNRSRTVEEIVEVIPKVVSEWVRQMHLKEFLWMILIGLPPPVGILKINFDGSFHNSSWRGGIGGVIRDHSGNLVRNFFWASVSLRC